MSGTECAGCGASMPPEDSAPALPPGPYRVEWPAEQGGLFTVWGRQGTPPGFADGWAIPLVAKGVQSVMEWLADRLNSEDDDRGDAWGEQDMTALPSAPDHHEHEVEGETLTADGPRATCSWCGESGRRFPPVVLTSDEIDEVAERLEAAHPVFRDRVLSALARSPSAPDHRLTGETLRKAIAAASDLTNPRLSEIEWDYVAAALSEPDPTYYDGRPDTPEEQRRISEALGEHRRSS